MGDRKRTLHDFFNIPGAPAASNKRKKTDLEKEQKAKEYEQFKRKREFQPSWLNKFDWLEYQSSENKMYCTVCKLYETIGSFVTGSSSMTKTSIKSHQNADGHKQNVLQYLANKKPGTSEAEQILEALNKDAFDKLTHLFRSAHALAKNARPFTDFLWLCKLDEAKGIHPGLDYRNDKQAAVFTEFIAKAEIAKIQEKVKDARFLSLISDGSTDSSFTGAEIVYLRFSDMGKLHVYFIAVTNVSNGSAEVISGVIIKAMEKHIGSDFEKKVVAVGTDGASVMTGVKSGVVVRIKEKLERPFIVGLHCCGHRLELSYKDAVKDVNLYKKIDAMLLGLYYFYRNSPLNRSNLKASFKTLNMPVLLLQGLEGHVGLDTTKEQ